MSQWSRRDFLRISLLAGAASPVLGASGFLAGNSLMSSALQAAAFGPADKKMLVIFLRGGQDGVNALIPHGDSSYNASPQSRPSLYIPPAASIDLNGFAALHPALGKLLDIHSAGHLASIHRVAYAAQSRSHFSSQQFWENAVPGDLALEEGWAQRLVDRIPALDNSPLPGASVSQQLQVTFRGNRVLAHVPSLATYSLGNSPADLKLLGAVPAGTGDAGSGILGVYSRPADGTRFDSLVRNTGRTLGSNLTHLEALGVNPSTYVPANGASYPSQSDPGDFPNNGRAWTFFRQLRDAVQLLKETDCRVAGVEISGFDTHSYQGALTGSHPALMETIAHGLRSVWLDMQSNINDVIAVTLSEFGRTSQENGSFGTDHGEASCMFVVGGQVSGGVYNCDASSWANGDLFSTPNGRYVAHRTDFRTVLAEILLKHFGSSPQEIDEVLPGYGSLAGPEFAPLNFLV